jgi:hypothetical protein
MRSGDLKSQTTSAEWEQRFHLFVRRLFNLRRWVWLVFVLVAALVYAWRRGDSHFVAVYADHEVPGASAYPLAVDPNLVGKYPSEAKSGGGYFYDDVLEYRVWLNPDRGAERLNGGSDYYEAFAQYERAEQFSRANKGAEEPLVLVRQIEWVNEPEPGHYVPEKTERITEWQVRWLAGSKRTSDSVQEFMKHPSPNRQ